MEGGPFKVVRRKEERGLLLLLLVSVLVSVSSGWLGGFVELVELSTFVGLEGVLDFAPFRVPFRVPLVSFLKSESKDRREVSMEGKNLEGKERKADGLRRCRLYFNQRTINVKFNKLTLRLEVQTYRTGTRASTVLRKWV